MTTAEMTDLLVPEWTEYADGGSRMRLLASRCRACGTVKFPRGDTCHRCSAQDTEHVTLGPEGELYAYTTVYVPLAGYAGPVPYRVAQVKFAEGPVVQAFLHAGADVEMRIGDLVDLVPYALPAADPVPAGVTYAARPRGQA